MLVLKLFLLCNYFLVSTSIPICDPDTNKCYIFIQSPLSFAQAESNCSTSGGHLTSVENVFENQFIQNNAQSEFGKYSSFWIGGINILGNSWNWTDDTSFTFTNWAPSFPSGTIPDVAIVFQTENGQWTDSLDVNSNSFVCSVPYVPTTTQQITTVQYCQPRALCDDGWTHLNGFCYKKISLNRNATEAEAFCQQEIGHLASIHSEVENDFVNELAANGIAGNWSVPQTYIGLQKINNNWSWTDNTKVDYVNWAPNNPNNVGGHQNVAQIFPDGGGIPDYPPKTWDDVNGAHEAINFICKKLANS